MESVLEEQKRQAAAAAELEEEVDDEDEGGAGARPAASAAQHKAKPGAGQVAATTAALADALRLDEDEEEGADVERGASGKAAETRAAASRDAAAQLSLELPHQACAIYNNVSTHLDVTAGLAWALQEAGCDVTCYLHSATQGIKARAAAAAATPLAGAACCVLLCWQEPPCTLVAFSLNLSSLRCALQDVMASWYRGAYATPSRMIGDVPRVGCRRVLLAVAVVAELPCALCLLCAAPASDTVPPLCCCAAAAAVRRGGDGHPDPGARALGHGPEGDSAGQ